MRLVLFEPDIPQNAGAILRLGACFGVPVDLVEPCGFVLDDRRLRRAGMDYIEQVELVRHSSWQAYRSAWQAEAPGARLVLLTTRGSQAYTDFTFDLGDRLVLGRESAGVPEPIHAEADARLSIPLRSGLRSLNVAQAAAMVLGEALRQLDAFPPHASPQDPPA